MWLKWPCCLSTYVSLCHSQTNNWPKPEQAKAIQSFILMSLYKCKMYVSRVETIWESLFFHLITWLPVFNVPQFIAKQDGKCSLCNEWWHSFMNQRLNHLVLLYKNCNCIRIMSLNTYNKNVDIIWHYCSVPISPIKNTPLYCQTQLLPSATGFQTQKS
jgi:hypothetical protein